MDGTSATFTVTDGKDGVGVASVAFNENGGLAFILTDGTAINLLNFKNLFGEGYRRMSLWRKKADSC